MWILIKLKHKVLVANDMLVMINIILWKFRIEKKLFTRNRNYAEGPFIQLCNHLYKTNSKESQLLCLNFGTLQNFRYGNLKTCTYKDISKSVQVSPESDIFSTTKTNESQQCIVQVRAETTVTPKPQYTEMLKHNVLSISTDKLK